MTVSPAENEQVTEGQDAAYRYACELANALRRKHFPEVPNWKPLDDVFGVLTQIDNMTTGLARHRREAQGREVWPEQAIRIAEALEHELMTERGGTLWCRLCDADTGADGQQHARSCVLFNAEQED